MSQHRLCPRGGRSVCAYPWSGDALPGARRAFGKSRVGALRCRLLLRDLQGPFRQPPPVRAP